MSVYAFWTLSHNWSVTPWMVPPQNRSPWTVRSRINGPPRTEYCSHTCSPLLRMVPPLVMAFRASVEAEKWARKDEADYMWSALAIG